MTKHIATVRNVDGHVTIKYQIKPYGQDTVEEGTEVLIYAYGCLAIPLILVLYLATFLVGV